MSVRLWCQTCEFWCPRDRNEDEDPQAGECRRSAPLGVSVLGDEGPQHIFGEWPRTLPHDFCGEHREKAA